jgi:cis-3-alkyl-4-acyloxetan-2-one decarboxylase
MNTLMINGTPVTVEGQGEQVVLMIHGWPDTAALWDGQVRALKAQYQCVRFTLPGFDTRGPAKSASLDEIVELIKAIAHQVSPGKPIILLVHDWGCLFGYQFANRYPQMVAKLIALDVGDTTSGAFFKSLNGKAKAFLAGYQLLLLVAYGLRFVLPPLANGISRWMAKKLGAPADSKAIGAQQNYPYWLQWSGGFKQAKTFKPHCPTLFFYGKRKPFMFHSEKWLETLTSTPGCAVYPMKTGHWIMIDDSEGVNRLMLEWLHKH